MQKPHRARRLAAPLTAALASLLLAACSSTDTPPITPDAGTPLELTILHTNDLHSHLNAYNPEADYTPTPDNDGTVGGFARLATEVKAQRAAAGSTPVLLLDAGDFMMGTTFQLLGTTQAAELTEMGKLGYDAITFGNHEFDWSPLGLAGFLQAATSHGFNVPIVASNITFDPVNSADDQLEAFQTAGLIVPKLVKTLSNGLKVGFFGIMGKNAAAVAPLAAPVTFADQVQTAQAMVNELRNTDKVDLVIMLSHSGSYTDGTGEDVDVANAVPGIDIIISGHTHVAIPQPIVAKTGTLVVQSGAFGLNLGEMHLSYLRSAKKLTLTSYKLQPIDDTIAADSAVQADIDGDVSAIDTMLQPYGLKYDAVLAETSFDLPKITFAEAGLGDLIADSYAAADTAVEGTPPDFAFEVGGNIRADLLKGKTGKLWFADLFRVEPLGIGPDQLPGYPLVSYYINGADLKAGLEISAAAEDFLKDDSLYLQVSGSMNVKYHPGYPVFERVESASVNGVPVDFNNRTSCYKVVSTLYVGELLGLVSAETHGLLSVTPKLADCSTPVAANATAQDPTGMYSRIVMVPGTQPTELKQWQAFIQYVSGFPDTNGDQIPDVPSVYSAPQGRVVAE